MADDESFATNPARLDNREALAKVLEPALRKRSSAEVIEGLEALKVPVGPVQRLDEVFASEQAAARDMAIEVPRGDVKGGAVRLIGNPLKMSRTPPSYRKAPPRLGEDTEEVLDRLTPDPENQRKSNN